MVLGWHACSCTDSLYNNVPHVNKMTKSTNNASIVPHVFPKVVMRTKGRGIFRKWQRIAIESMPCGRIPKVHYKGTVRFFLSHITTHNKTHTYYRSICLLQLPASILKSLQALYSIKIQNTWFKRWSVVASHCRLHF